MRVLNPDSDKESSVCGKKSVVCVHTTDFFAVNLYKKREAELEETEKIKWNLSGKLTLIFPLCYNGNRICGYLV